MALTSTDPKVLFQSAGCFNCPTPHQEIVLQTYYLAKTAGLDTSATGVRSLATLSACYDCLTVYQLIRLRQYLYATIVGLPTNQAGVQSLVAASKCVLCLTPRQQLQLETYLLAVSAGQATTKAGVSAAMSAAKCFACYDTKQQYQIQAYILAGLASLEGSTVSSLLQAAGCFESCLMPRVEQAVSTYLATTIAGAATPPCVTPSHPFQVQVAQKGVTDTNTQLSVRWQQLANAGSLITGYIVYWGTTSGGPYTNNSGVVPITPKNYIISGLSSGTTYYVVVQAVTAINGCVSTNSAESNGTTTGALPSNQLLQSLISYWKFDDNQGSGATTADSIGTNQLLLSNANTSVAGKINLGLDAHTGSSAATHATNSDFDPGANTSISFSFWVSATDWAGFAGQVNLVTKGSSTAAATTYEFYIDGVNAPAGRAAWVVSDATGPTLFGDYLSAAKPTGGVFHHIVGVFNSASKRVQGYFDGVQIFDEPTTSGTLHTVATQFQVSVGAGNTSIAGLVIDELGMWHKALTQTDVTNLYNGGAGLPLSSFGA